MKFSAALLFAFANLVAAPPPDHFTLHLLHVNDTHSRVDPTPTKLTFDLDEQLKGRSVYAEMGGYAQAAEVIKKLQAKNPEALLVHAGDLVQGSLYFTKYEGATDIPFWNSLKTAVATLGNHEFDKGTPFLFSKLLKPAQFSIVSSNVEFPKRPETAEFVPKPYLILAIGKQQVAFLGATTPETPFISSPGPEVTFSNPAGAVQKQIDTLTKQGINKIVLISHLGFEVDVALASQCTGLDVIVGGHSHTLLGNWASLGLTSGHPYPTLIKNKAGDNTLVVQAWEWAKVIGNLKVTFDSTGKVVGWEGMPTVVIGNQWFKAPDLPNPAGELKQVQFTRGASGVKAMEFDGKDFVQVPDPLNTFYTKYLDKIEASLSSQACVTLASGDPATKQMMSDFHAGVKDLQLSVVAQVSEDMKRGLNSGPGPLVADAMRAKAGVQIAVVNIGGVRTDLLRGPLTVAQIYELMPFNNTLVTMRVRGKELLQVLEETVDFSLIKFGKGLPANPLLYISGIKCSLNTGKLKGDRISGVTIEKNGQFENLDLNSQYSIVVNNFMANGGDVSQTLKTIKGVDTGFIDAEAFLEFIQNKSLKNPEPRVQAAL